MAPPQLLLLVAVQRTEQSFPLEKCDNAPASKSNEDIAACSNNWKMFFHVGKIESAGFSMEYSS
jgi:hypothetical protein